MNNVMLDNLPTEWNGYKQFDFYGYFSSIKDEVEKVLDNGAQYKGLSWKMTSKKPSRTP